MKALFFFFVIIKKDGFSHSDSGWSDCSIKRKDKYSQNSSLEMLISREMMWKLWVKCSKHISKICYENFRDLKNLMKISDNLYSDVFFFFFKSCPKFIFERYSTHILLFVGCIALLGFPNVSLRYLVETLHVWFTNFGPWEWKFIHSRKIHAFGNDKDMKVDSDGSKI